MATASDLLLQDPLFGAGRRRPEPPPSHGIVVVVDGTTTRLRFGDPCLVERALYACNELGIEARRATSEELRAPAGAEECARAARLICHLAPRLGLGAR